MDSGRNEGFQHQEVCGNQPCPSLTLPLKMLCRSPLRIGGIWGQEPPVFLHDPVINLSLLRTLAFRFVWPHCASGTRTCVPLTPLLLALADSCPILRGPAQESPPSLPSPAHPDRVGTLLCVPPVLHACCSRSDFTVTQHVSPTGLRRWSPRLSHLVLEWPSPSS